MQSRHRSLIQWAKANALDLPQPYGGLIAQRRALTAQQRRETSTITRGNNRG